MAEIDRQKQEANGLTPDQSTGGTAQMHKLADGLLAEPKRLDHNRP
ncbi:hypothetical protein [Rhizobium deserti]|nr:hypothetical protein [Rhizobium deserti]